MTPGQRLIEAIAAERSRQTDRYDPLIALGRAIVPLVNERLTELEKELAAHKRGPES